MERVTVAELKAKLSHYLREVRAGKSFTVTSRDIPIATLGPHESDDFDDLEVIAADANALPLWESVLGPTAVAIDAADLIREDRDASDQRLEEIMRESYGGCDRGHEDSAG